MRLIDADKLLETYKKWIPQLLSKEDEGDRRGVETCIMVLEDMQTAVVRCRECIAYTPVDDNTGKCVFLIGEHQYVVPDGYCYLGERKEGADNDT